MYRPKFYDEKNRTEAFRLVRENPFAILASHGDKLQATHLPLILDHEAEIPRLIGHMAKANTQWKEFESNNHVLAIFCSANAYISPNWYVHEADVPTWNYSAVHIYGKLRLIHDWDETRSLLARSVNNFEAQFASPWRLEDLDEAVVSSFQRAIVAFEIDIDTIECARKLGQDKHEDDVRGAIAGLDSQCGYGAKNLAEEMKRVNESKWVEEKD